MKMVVSDFIVKGCKNGNEYYIVKNPDNNYNVYQVFCETNKDTSVKDIKKILPYLKPLDDDEIIVSLPNEQYAGFLFLNYVDIYEMNRFRITLNDEEEVCIV